MVLAAAGLLAFTASPHLHTLNVTHAPLQKKYGAKEQVAWEEERRREAEAQLAALEVNAKAEAQQRAEEQV